MTFSFMSANFVARQLGYQMTGGWMQGDQATNDWFRPLATFEERFETLLREITELGYDTVDLWTAHLNYQWATPEHIATARRLLGCHRLRVASCAGGFGSHPAEFRAACRVAAELGIPVLGGGTALLSSNRPAMVAILRSFGLAFGLENHPEKTPAVLLDKLGAGDEDVMGVAIDTGWFGTQGYNAADAIRQIGPRLKHVHLKDILAAGSHHTCALGQGVVPIAECITALKTIGYAGAISLEHEPESYDPRPDCRAGLELVKRAWAV